MPSSPPIASTPVSILHLPQPYPACIQRATYKNVPEDFQVHEILGFKPTGEGEHLLLHIEKRGANTGYIAGQLARWADIANKHVGTCGLKDRHAVTRQWFSLWLPKRQAPDTPFTHDEAKVLSSTWHQRKLPTGAHKGNTFRIVLRDITPADSWEAIEHTLRTIAQRGIPNYFGAQRFGHNGSNIERARAWMQRNIKVKRQQEGMLLSAARSLIFNRILAQRVANDTWDTPLADDIFNLNASNSVFTPENGITEDIKQRCAEGDIHPTGVLWGKRKNAKKETEDGANTINNPLNCVSALEQQVADDLPILSKGLEAAGANLTRRSLRVIPTDFAWECNSTDHTITLTFTLPKGCYATSVLAALGAVTSAAPTSPPINRRD